MKQPRIWYVIADGGRARFVARDENGAFRTVLSFVAADMQKRSSDLGRDRPSRVKESANVARHAVEPRRDLHEAAKEDFIALVAEQIAAEHGEDLAAVFDRSALHAELTAAAVTEAARRYLDPTRYVKVTLVPDLP